MRKRFQSFMGNSYDTPLSETKSRSCSTSHLDSTDFCDSPTRLESPTFKSVKRQASTVSLHLRIRQKHKKSSAELTTIDSDLEDPFEENINDSVFYDPRDISRTFLAPILPPEAAPLKSPSSPPVSTLPRLMKNGKLRKNTSFKTPFKDFESVIIYFMLLRSSSIWQQQTRVCAETVQLAAKQRTTKGHPVVSQLLC